MRNDAFSTVLRTPEGEWKFLEILCLSGGLVCVRFQFMGTDLHVDLQAICHRHDFDLMWFGHQVSMVYGDTGGNWSANWIEP